MPQRDVLLRWIEQIAKVVARLLYGPGPPDLELASTTLEEAIAQLVGPLVAILPHLDVPSGASLLHDPDRMYGYARLLGLLAAVQQARGDQAAAATSSRAIAFAREALARLPVG